VSANTNTDTDTDTDKASPFRATAVERYARTREAAVPVRRPPGALLVVLWVLLLVTLAAGGVWLTVAWRYFAG
jgi:cobalamin biosynthesis Mg chelatase CobN